MGSILKLMFGKIIVETPKYELIRSTPDYEIRKYLSSVIAELTYDPTQFKGDKDAGFAVLTNYIGIIGKPQNTKPEEKISMTTPVITKTSEKIAMTTPVITKTSEKIAMTTPVVTKEGDNNKLITMQFTLPSKYTRAEDAPKPVDERVVIREEVEIKYGVVTFSGVASDGVVKMKVEELKKSLERDGHKIIGDFVLARYNPTWSLPPFRTNEVRIPIE